MMFVPASARMRRRVLEAPLFGLSLGALVAVGAAHAAGAPVLPTGGKVAAGQASIGPALGGSLTVTQSSSKAILNWNGFSIGAGGQVQFDNGSGATLNRVTGTSVSSLNGLLSATGSVYLLNPNGVIVGRSGVVDVGGTFIASTLNLTDQNFLQGGPLSFTGRSSAAVVNLGKVGALGGDVALIASTVSNQGAITAANGTAGLISGYSVVMRDASLDGGLFSVLVGGSGSSVTNSGLIQAASAELRAEGGNVYALAGDTAGVIRATGVQAGQGKVWLVADGGQLDVAGTIEAAAADGEGGSIETSGRQVAIGKASINAHGGSWLVDPVDLTIDSTAATTIDASLNAGTSVTEQTTATASSGAGTVNSASGSGDIIVAAPLSWSTDAALTLSAYRNVDVNASIASTGGGAVTLQADNAATSIGTVIFGSGGSISTAGQTTILYNPASYTTPTDFTADVTGGGTLAAYMLVNTPTELSAIDTNLSGSYALNPGLADGLDLSSVANFTPIGTDAAPFTGVFNGSPLTPAGGFGEGTISNLTINLPNTISVGLFGNLGAGGVVENLALEGGSVTGFNAVGGLVGKNSGTVNDVDVDLAVSGNDAIGGVVGKNFGLVNLSESGFNEGATVSGQDYVGGVVGYNTVLNGSTAPSTAVATDDFSVAAVSGAGDYIGGLVGFNSTGSTVASSLYGLTFYGTVNGAAASTGVGGVAGYNAGVISGGTLLGTLGGGTVTSSGISTGGVVGLNDVGGVVSGALSEEATVAGGDATGGLVGKNYGTVTAGETAATAISGLDATGGVVGKNFDIVDGSEVVSGSTVSGVNYVGGVVGWNTTPTGSTAASTASVQDDSRAGASTQVTGTGVDIGGVVGRNDAGSIVTASAQNGGLVQGTGMAGQAIGGLIGYNAGALSNSDTGAEVVETSANTGATPDALGGAVGYNAAGGSISGVVNEFIADFPNSVTGSFSYAGGLAGYNAGSISGSSSVDAVATTGGGSAGGLVGYNDTGATITGSTASGTVTVASATGGAFAYAGGLAGYNDGSITNATSAGSVSETGASDSSNSDLVGGLVGLNDADGVVGGSQATGAVAAQGIDFAGGLVGQNLGMITGSAATGAVSVTGSDGALVGGLVGDNEGVIGGASVSYALGSVTVDGAAFAGGLVGLNDGTVTQAYASGAVTDTGGANGAADGSYLGGLVGFNDGEISYAYSLGAVAAPNAADDTLGGLVGLNVGSISQAYATGLVSAPNVGVAIGGVAGENDGTIDNTVFFDQTTTGQTAADGGGSGADAATAINVGGALSPYAQATYTGLNFGSGGFVIFEGSTRPFLQSEEPADGGVITNLHQLQLVAVNPSFSYTLGADIDASPTSGANASDMWSATGFVQIGDAGTEFTGTFNGADPTSGVTHTITDLNIARPTEIGVGLFGYIGAAGVVENVDLSGGLISGSNATGAVAGKNAGLVTDVTVAGASVTGANSVGGVVGKNFGTVDYATSSATVNGADYVGGVVGYNTAVSGSGPTSTAVVSDSENDGSVAATGKYVGGVVGYNDVGSTLTNVVDTGSVTGSVLDAGGIAGFNAGAIIGATYDGGDIFGGSASNVGGIAGYNSGTVSGVSGMGSVGDSDEAGVSSVGGIVGYNDVGGVVSNATFDGFVEAGGANAVGGIVGKNYGAVTGVQAGEIGSGGDEIDLTIKADVAPEFFFVEGQDAVGGVVGKNFGSVTTATSSGEVDGRQYVGGVVGWNTTHAGATTPSNPTVNAASSSSFVEGGSDVGGLVGRNDAAGTITGSSATGNIDLYANSGVPIGPAGGLVGYNAGVVTTSYSGAGVEAESTGTTSAGAFTGLGGLVGENAGTVSDVYAYGSTDGNGYSGYGVGGLVGINDAAGAVSRGYASGVVSNTTENGDHPPGTIGGVAGVNSGALNNLYFDEGVTGQTFGVGASNSSPATTVTAIGGSTGLDPYSQSTYTGFDFANVWFSVDGSTRPLLRSEYSTTITNAHQLQLMALDPTATYTLAADIDASGTQYNASDVWRNASTASADGSYGFAPVGSASTPFTGVLFGQGDDISGLASVRPATTSVGLFGNIGSTAFISSVNFEFADISGLNAVGVLAGKSAGTVLDVAVYDSIVSGAGGVGGVIGKNFGDAFGLTNISTDVTGSGVYVGGVVGYNGAAQDGSTTGAATLSDADFEGTVTGTAANVENDVGGAVGYNAATGIVINSTGFGTVTGAGYAVGGLVGKNAGGVEDSYVENAAVTGVAAVGGVVGKNFGTVSYDSTVAGTVSGAQYVGGLVGYNGAPQGSGSTTPAVIFNSRFNYAVQDTSVTGTATTNAEADVGGVVGFNDPYGQISEAFAEGVTTQGAAVAGSGGSTFGGYAVGGLAGKNLGSIFESGAYDQTTIGSQAVGGVVGKNLGTVTLVDADGTITGDEYVGGVVGYNGSSNPTASTPAAIVTSALFDFGTVSGLGGGGAGTEADVGGLVGYNAAGGQVSNSSIGNFLDEVEITSAGDAVGGAIGKNAGAASVLLVDGVVIQGEDSVGGLIGRNFGSLTGAIADENDVVGADFVGGAIGYSGAADGSSTDTATVDQVTSQESAVEWSGDGSGHAFGGLIGRNDGSITNSYTYENQVDNQADNDGGALDTDGMTNVGGFAGVNRGSITTSYSYGSTATGGTKVGAFVGVNRGMLNADYYDSDGATAAEGSAPYATMLVGSGSKTKRVTALPADEYSTPSAYAGFDFTKTWSISPTGGNFGGILTPYLTVENQVVQQTISLLDDFDGGD